MLNPTFKAASSASISASLGIALLLSATSFASAEEAAKTTASAPPQIVETLYLNHINQNRDLMEATNDLRNMVPHAAVYAVASLNAITVRGTSDELQSAKKILADLDRPRQETSSASLARDFRLTYTITEMEGDKRGAAQHFSLTLASEGHGTIKHGDRVPIATGAMETAHSSPVNQVQFQYIDVGINISASLDNGTLRTKVERSSVSEQKSTLGVEDPIIQQVTLENVSNVVPSKPILVGSLDLPNSTRSLQVEVVADPIQ